VGVIITENRTAQATVPADPADASSHEKHTQQAGGVWFPDSAFKTAQVQGDIMYVCESNRCCDYRLYEILTGKSFHVLSSQTGVVSAAGNKICLMRYSGYCFKIALVHECCGLTGT
jgi:hypothetical protein